MTTTLLPKAWLPEMEWVWNEDLGRWSQRSLPSRGEEGVWVHVLNKTVTDPVETLAELAGVEGEICASDPEDWERGTLFQLRGWLFAAVFAGPAEAVWDSDVYSSVDEVTGRRVMGDGWGKTRIEAWIIPTRQTLIGVICTNEEWAEALRAKGIQVWALGNGHAKHAHNRYSPRQSWVCVGGYELGPGRQVQLIRKDEERLVVEEWELDGWV